MAHLRKLTQNLKFQNEHDFISGVIELVKVATDEFVFRDLMTSVIDFYREDKLKNVHIETLNTIVRTN